MTEPSDHLKHIQQFLLEMYQTMIDPVEEFDGNIEQLCVLLLQRAREDREKLASLLPAMRQNARYGHVEQVDALQKYSAPPAPPPIDEIGWLLARGGDGKPPEWITVEAGFLAWNADVNKALRLARCADAEMLAEIVDDCERIEDHIWTATPSQTIDERAEFEKWLATVHTQWIVRWQDEWNQYSLAEVQVSWQAWQARASLERTK